MATEHAREHDPLSPLRDGDFQRIAGIGPGIAQRLHAAGIQTFRQLAAMSPDEIYAQLNGLVGMTPERIAHQDWPGKAEQLSQVVASAVPFTEPEEPGERQHYTSFMIELLQDENDIVRRTRIVHVQNGEKGGWAGWDVERLAHWITNQAMIVNAVDNPAESPVRSLSDMMALELGVGDILLPSGEASTRFLIEDQAFMINLPLKIKAKNLPTTPLHYRATVQAQPVAGPRSQPTEVNGQFYPQEDILLSIPVEGLTEGAYRLEISLLVYPEDAVRPEREGYSAFSEGGLIYVFSRETEAAD